MAPSAIATESSLLHPSEKAPAKVEEHAPYLNHLAASVFYNLQYQHDWTSLTIHTHSPSNKKILPRPTVSGIPPRRAYIHPDEQVEILKAEHDTGKSIEQIPEQEWVLPTHWDEKWSLARFSEVFDALDTVPLSTSEESQEEDDQAVGAKWQGKNRQKRLLLATIHDDSTVVYYIMHDGIVKPRQN